MAYRNGTYVAFHANGNNIPGKTDIDYYRLMTAWSSNPDDDFTMNNSHDKASAVRDSSKKATLRASLQERLRQSKNLVLIIGNTTRLDDDWIPFEIEQAVDCYKIPIIAVYTTYSGPIRVPSAFRQLWPSTLTARIDNHTANVIHIPFKKAPIMDAISQFSHNNLPKGGLWFYSNDAYKTFGIEG